MISVFYKPLLSDDEQKAYDRILDAIIHYEDSVTVYGLHVDRVLEVFRCIGRDRPELFFVRRDISAEYTDSYVTLFPEYCYGEYEAKAILGKIDAAADNIVSKTKAMTQHDAALYLHDYLATTIEYTRYDNKTWDAYSIVGALENRRCVCEGYARAYKYLCDKAGIRCIMVTGYGTDSGGITEGHAWNIVKLGEHSYHVDVTFDSYEHTDYCSRANFLLSSDQASFNHVLDGEYPYPVCAVSGSLLPVINSFQDLKAALRRDSKAGRKFTEYRFISPVKTVNFIKKIQNGFDADDPFGTEYLDHISHYTYSARDTIVCFGVVWK